MNLKEQRKILKVGRGDGAQTYEFFQNTFYFLKNSGDISSIKDYRAKD